MTARRLLGFVLLSLTALTAFMPTRARAWGNEGHKVIAHIAERHLTPHARAMVDRLLDADHDRRTGRDLASRATWADRYRDSDRGTTQEHYDLTRRWHFVDLEIDKPDLDEACFGHPPSATPASAGPAKSCVVDRIDAFETELRQLSGTSHERIVAFKFLLHLVGDIHQPLHAADNHDKGGNEVLVLFGRHVVGQSLHSYWDTDVVRALGTDAATVAATLDRRMGRRCQAWMKGTPADWAMQSFKLARADAYHLGKRTEDRNGHSAYILTPYYQQRAKRVAAEQLERAGCRLAMLLNQAFPR